MGVCPLSAQTPKSAGARSRYCARGNEWKSATIWMHTWSAPGVEMGAHAPGDRLRIAPRDDRLDQAVAPAVLDVVVGVAEPPKVVA